jgi:REP element-mobilizing transposase RayT
MLFFPSMKRFHSVSQSLREHWEGKHRFEHWYRDNSVYFITARCRDRYLAFASEPAKQIFWDRFENWTHEYEFKPWLTTLIDNHYHTIGYLKEGKNLGQMMRKLHGSVAKLVDDTLPTRHLPFWREAGGRDYFDGCLRDESQCRKAHRYTLTQCRRHGICKDWRDYPHTHVWIDVDRGVKRALELNAFMGVCGTRDTTRSDFMHH